MVARRQGPSGTHAPHRAGARRAGQTALETLLVLAVLLATVAILAVVLFTTREQGGRVLDLVASEYP